MANGRSTEVDISEAVLRILAGRANGEATIGYLKNQIPNLVNLTAGDREQSLTRPNEELWEQLVRNIVSHKATEGNYIQEGYLTAPSRGRLRITDAGRRKVAP
jgi:hypothetical protein